ncbi:angiogenic factor with G patch and FHA domains 1 isoform X1 [Pristis pectinata]|uniref:angiogenic factor with G patch and FHA domains 1 isoform X1 n=1 Tax=Pristis pectinata TaxID=685728 RepID=UPI00223DB3DB|nr:angiogenic factor with G patch and FHA domains 1 isoform X1 [Pristis pectinata]XP_051875091.1 angiogenic factor with G patch and FHA domains 1 isoform X1 [Pristis pectinata]
MAAADWDLQSDCNSELRDLKQKVINLEQELTTCKNQLLVLQKELNHTEVLYKGTKSCNEQLYKQVKDLSEKLHERKKSENNRVDVEVQTDLCFTQEHRDFQKEDLYFHYHLKSDQNDGWQEDSVPAIAQSQTQPQTDCYQDSEIVQTDSYPYTDCPDESTLPDESGDHKNVNENTGDSKNISLAESLRATAEAAMSQTGFTYDESSGLYYDYSTGFYYDSTNQLYYDPNTGIYYYYDAGSGLYQFHSRVDLPPYQTADTEKKVKKKRKGVEKLEQKEEKDIEAKVPKASRNSRFWDLEEKELPSAEKRKKAKMVDIDQSSSNGLNPNLGLSVQGEGDVKVKLEEEEEAGFASEPEEGEITDSEKSGFVDEETEESSEGEDDEDTKEGRLWPPCIRVMVVRSPVLEPGTLFIITAVKSATIGREKDMGHAIRIAELGVSKFHAEVYFDQDLQVYMLVDKGSQNGTVVNGNRILAVKNKCDPHRLEHGDEVKFGETVLSFHIHPGTDTCNGCEPGQVIAHLRLNKKEESAALPVLSKQEKDKLRRHKLKQIQVKYGLQNSAYERGEPLKNLMYKDRAAKRRQEIGSDGIFKRDDAPASIHVEICDDNKGRKMLEKMGWKKGEGLGKGSCGIKEPIQVQLLQSQSGLGANLPLSIEDAQLYRSKKHKNWAKARARFSETFQQTTKTSCVKAECTRKEPEDSTI